MTSQLNVDTIVDKAGTGGATLSKPTITEMANTSTYVSDGGSVTQNVVQGLAKSWCNTNQSGAEIYDSFNIASLTDSGTGQQQPFFTNSMSNNRYAVELNVTSNINQTWCQNVATGGYVSKSYTGSAFEDREHLTTVHGDLA